MCVSGTDMMAVSGRYRRSRKTTYFLCINVCLLSRVVDLVTLVRGPGIELKKVPGVGKPLIGLPFALHVTEAPE